MEGDAGASRLTPNDTDDSSVEPDAVADETTAAEAPEDSREAEDAADHEITESNADDESATTEAPEDPGAPSRLGRSWFIGIAATLIVLAGGIGAGGYLALRSHLDSRATARHDAAAVEAAKDCVGATQAPDIAAMASSAQQTNHCCAGAF